MALNLLNVATVTAVTTYQAPAVATAVTALTNASASAHIFKVNSSNLY